jgi:hypothetical protein
MGAHSTEAKWLLQCCRGRTTEPDPGRGMSSPMIEPARLGSEHQNGNG